MTDQNASNRSPWRWATYFGLVGFFLGVISAINRVCPDAYHQMALIREAVATGSLPMQDVFAYTPTVNPSVHHEWGAGAVFYAASMAFGSYGILLIKYGGALLLGVGCFALARRRGVSVEVFAILAPVAIFCGCIGVFSVRAQMFTLLGTVCLLFFLDNDQNGGRWWISLWLPIYVAWLNMHAGFLVGVGLFGIYSTGCVVNAYRRHRSVVLAIRATRHLLGVAGAMGILFVCNPYGLSYASYLWHAVRMERPIIAEWQSVWHTPPVLVVYLFSLLPIAYVVWRKSLSTIPDLLMVAVPALLAFQHIRHLSIYAVVWACYVPAGVEKSELGQLITNLSYRYRALFALLWISLGAIGLVQASHNRFWLLRIPATAEDDSAIHFPVGAVDYLKECGFVGHLMVPFNVGGYVSWNLYPAVKVSTDGRYEVAYPPEQVHELCDFYANQQDWQQTLCRFPPDAVLVPRPNRLEHLLSHPSGSGSESSWYWVYRDDGFTIYVPSDTPWEFPVVDRSGKKIIGRFP